MKAAVITRYGSPDVIRILDAPKPTPAADEILIRVLAATVNRTDCGELRPRPFFARLFFGLLRPRRTIFGLDFAGEIEAVGAGIVSFKEGDRVFGMCPGGRKNFIFSLPQAIEARRALCLNGSRTLGAERRACDVVVDHTEQPGCHSTAGAHRRVCQLLEKPHGGGPI